MKEIEQPNPARAALIKKLANLIEAYPGHQGKGTHECAEQFLSDPAVLGLMAKMQRCPIHDHHLSCSVCVLENERQRTKLIPLSEAHLNWEVQAAVLREMVKREWLSAWTGEGLANRVELYAKTEAARLRGKKD